jgi:hypothetical protein
MPNFTNTYNLYKITKSNKYFIAHQSIPFTKFPKQNWTFEDQIESPTPFQALQSFSTFNPYLFLITN